MILDAANSDRVIFRGHSLSEDDFSLAQESVTTLLSEGNQDETAFEDAVFRITTDALVTISARIIPQVIVGFDHSPIYRSQDPSIATVDSTGLVDRIADGIVRVLVTIGFVTRRISVSVSRSSGSTYSLFDRWENNTIGQHCANAIAPRVDGKNSESAINLYSNAATRNAESWCADVDLTSVAYSNSYGPNVGGTLITPQHFIAATHYFSTPSLNGVDVPIGTEFTWIHLDGTPVVRTMTDKITINAFPDGDFVIGKLNAAVPEGIGLAKVLPADWQNRLPSIINRITPGVPCIRVDQFRRACITNWYANVNNGIQMRKPLDNLMSWYRDVVGGDSGKPAFLLINGEAVLLTLWFGGGAGSGFSIPANIDAINAGIAAIGGGDYQLTISDIAEFADF